MKVFESVWWIALCAPLFMAVFLAGCGVDGTSQNGDSPNISDQVIRGKITYSDDSAASAITVINIESGEQSVTDSSGAYSIHGHFSSESTPIQLQGENFSVTITLPTTDREESTVDLQITEDKNNARVIASSNPPEVNDGPFAPSGDTNSFGIPTGLTGNAHRGKKKYVARCSSCHSNIRGYNMSFGTLKRTIEASPMFLHLSNSELADIVAFLNFRNHG